uniref:Secreted protein n=1 Tax=Romanomermis culicivorax TaxID=13658 RepID=A0A915KP77_ROMCU
MKLLWNNLYVDLNYIVVVAFFTTAVPCASRAPVVLYVRSDASAKKAIGSGWPAPLFGMNRTSGAGAGRYRVVKYDGAFSSTWKKLVRCNQWKNFPGVSGKPSDCILVSRRKGKLQFCGKRPTISTQWNESLSFARLLRVDCIPFRSVEKGEYS